MTQTPQIAAVIVARNRIAALEGCLRSVLAQHEPAFEAVVVLNGATAEVEAVAQEAARQDPRVRLLSCAPASASTARNLGVAHARAPVLYFIDDDVALPEHAFGAALALLRAHPEVSIAGGPNLTPADDPFFGQVTGALLASPWGTGITYTRYRARAEGPAGERDLILCNLVVRREVFERGHAFPDLFGGEENVLMGRARADGLRFWYSPDLWVHHARRRSLRGYVEQMKRYGRGRAIAMLSAPHTVHPLFFAPLVFTAYLGVLPFAASFGMLAALPLAMYAAGTVLAALHAAARARRPAFVLPLLVLFPLTHVVYALGLGQFLLSSRRADSRRCAHGRQ